MNEMTFRPESKRRKMSEPLVEYFSFDDVAMQKIPPTQSLAG